MLGSLPLDRSIRENGDKGVPPVVAELAGADTGVGPEIVFQ